MYGWYMKVQSKIMSEVYNYCLQIQFIILCVQYIMGVCKFYPYVVCELYNWCI